MRRTLFMCNRKPRTIWNWAIQVWFLENSYLRHWNWSNNGMYAHSMSLLACCIIPTMISSDLPFCYSLLPACFFCLFVSSTVAVTRTNRRRMPAIFCWIQIPVTSSYITATDLLRIYRVNAIYLLIWPQRTHAKQLFFWIGRAWQAGARQTQPLTGIQVTNQSILSGNRVNVWPCVERIPLLHLYPDVCLPLFPDNGRRDFIRCLHPSSFPSLPPTSASS